MTDVPLDDRGFTLGHGLFETVLWTEGRLDAFDDHAERMRRGCRALGLPLPDAAALEASAHEALAAAGKPARAAVRLTWTAGSGARGLDTPVPITPRLTAQATPSAPPAEPARLAIARTRRNDRSPTSRLKSLAYLDNVLARAEAQAAGADEALMLNTAGEIACAAAANIFWIRHGEVFTPTLEAGVLDGIIRRRVIAACHDLGLPLHEVFANPGRLNGAPMFITNSLIGVRAVSDLNGSALPTSPLVSRIAKAVSRSR
jgi:branched-subunit amino acid aminotransferase/4-amino-4-deoxychorismate lyase